MTTDIKSLMVRAATGRNETRAYYMMPEYRETIRYALEELTEMDDEHLRTFFDHQRNNHRVPSHDRFMSELAQALCMTLDIALHMERESPDDFRNAVTLSSYWRGLDTGTQEQKYTYYYSCAIINLGGLLKSTVVGKDNGEEKFWAMHECAYTIHYIVAIANLFGYSATELVDKRYAQVKEKWGNAVGKGGQESITSGEGAA